MSKAKHTPAPWSASKQIYENPNGAIYKKINHLVNGSGVEGLAVVHEGCLGEDSIAEMESNARLIAASPTMYEALKMVVSALKDGDGHGDGLSWREILEIEELIKKIEG